MKYKCNQTRMKIKKVLNSNAVKNKSFIHGVFIVEDAGETEDPQPEEGTEEEGQNDDDAAPVNTEGSEPSEVPAEDG